MKYYGTLVEYSKLGKIDVIKAGLSVAGQYRLVVKAKSRAGANRRYRELSGEEVDIFLAEYTSETRNPEEVELCDKYGEILGEQGTGSPKYIDLKAGL